jgi:hypothetical protein
VAGVGEGADGVAVGLVVAGDSVGDGVGADVGDAALGDTVDEGRLAVGTPEAAGLGLLAGAPHAATRARIRSATAG